jgi:hypothetical protein
MLGLHGARTHAPPPPALPPTHPPPPPPPSALLGTAGAETRPSLGPLPSPPIHATSCARLLQPINC